jgi:small-conductance mechanosensitive channel
MGQAVIRRSVPRVAGSCRRTIGPASNYSELEMNLTDERIGQIIATVLAAIALADVFLSVAGWLYIVTRDPFRVGDRIEIGSHSGDVVDVRVLRFTLMEIGNWVGGDQPTGRLVHVPNRSLFRESMANYTETFDHIWHEIPITVTFESDHGPAERRIQETLEKHQTATEVEQKKADFAAAASHHVIPVSDFAPTVYLDVTDFGVQLTARTVIHPRERRQIHDRIWRDVLERLADEPTVRLAYPTMRTVSD